MVTLSAPRGIRALALLVLVALCALPFAAARAAPAVDPAAVRLEVVVPEGAAPFVDEMVLVTVRGTYDTTIALETLRQPEFRNFGWMQLGRDSWRQAFVDGKQKTVFERRLALFPHAAGRQTIASFTHRLTLVAGNGERFVHDVVSPPVSVEVAPRPATAGGWWMPARAVTYSDDWDMDAAALVNGATVTRRVTIRAVGVPPQSLPPPPRMRADWLISFFAPETRSVELTPDGPVSTVEWVWRMRPITGEPGHLPAFTIPWYDTAARLPREIVLKSQTIAYAGFSEGQGEAGPIGLLKRNAPILAGAGGFLAALALLLPGLRLRSRAEMAGLLRRLSPDGDARALRRAAAAGDAPAARQAALAYLAPRGGAGIVPGAFARLDAALYGQARERPDLAAFARAVLSARRRRGS
ncbi:BatD family protein [Aurantimonas sp. Leaf443]|uniref:BatD family protein n=1 Tax=Aurantimonas sp. Leaf443 TaxID=1736378 RepID=UPI0006FABF88|nr:BatD family protein [Aurantimonas sp. Leaf443]KQT82190.1 hypothetical protein ASG48_16255 [Aurantimonas sp. Leaf443]